jgi:hypothetical protein
MQNKKGNVAVIAIIITIVAVTASAVTWYVATKSQVQNQAKNTPQSISIDLNEIDTQITTLNEESIKEYKSSDTFSLSYPSQICDDSKNKCYPVELIEDESVISLDASDGGLFKIYYGKNINDEKSANNFLQTVLKNQLCKITNEKRIIQGTAIRNVFLDGGCTLYGPKYEKYSSDNPEAIGLSGKVRAYWSTNSNELIVYVVGQGGGCAFVDCNTEEEISKSIMLDGINISSRL